ncbi:hypothetical protein [Azospirillum himalayense]|uniref:Uncharacterized protein n=1 Tax=Azospirillum himalayense TaxID=654847 RepID=A0ABW0G1G1_9PROT
MTILGIDPGLSGALAFIDGASVRVYDMPVLSLKRNGKAKNEPDFLELARIIREVEGVPSFAVVEQVSAMPGQGVSSMFAFGKTYGGILGVLAALSIRTELVAPVAWKRWHRIKPDSGKDASRAAAKNLFPHQAGLFARVKDDGRADATLIASWGLHQTKELAA